MTRNACSRHARDARRRTRGGRRSAGAGAPVACAARAAPIRVEAGRLCQSLEPARQRAIRLCRRTEQRWAHAGRGRRDGRQRRHRRQRQPGRQLRRRLGAVYVFTRSGGGWAQQAYIKASNTGANDQFGSAVALSADGNTLAVAAQFEDSAATGINGNQADNSMPNPARSMSSRAAEAPGHNRRTSRRRTPGGGRRRPFGYSLALSDGSMLVVGATAKTAADRHQRQPDQQRRQAPARCTCSPAAADMVAAGVRQGRESCSTMATSVRLFRGMSADGNTLDRFASTKVGRQGDQRPRGRQADGSGAAYVVTRSGTTWSQQAYLKSPTQDRGDSMGTWITISSPIGFDLLVPGWSCY